MTTLVYVFSRRVLVGQSYEMAISLAGYTGNFVDVNQQDDGEISGLPLLAVECNVNTATRLLIQADANFPVVFWRETDANGTIIAGNETNIVTTNQANNFIAWMTDPTRWPNLSQAKQDLILTCVGLTRFEAGKVLVRAMRSLLNTG